MQRAGERGVTTGMRGRRRRLLLAGLVALASLAGALTAWALPPAFTVETVAAGFNAPVQVAFLPDGRALVAEHAGLVRLVQPNGTKTTFLDLRSRVNNYGERGLIGIALDPDFANRPYLYAYYIFEHDAANPTGPKTGRLARYTVSGDTASLASEVALLGSVGGDSCAVVTSDCIPSDYRDHHGGTIRFAPDGTIFVTTGDGATVHGITPNALRSQNIDSLAGKLLHVDRDGNGLAAQPPEGLGLGLVDLHVEA